MIQELMIAAFTPSFLQKEVLWFEENAEKIRKISKGNPRTERAERSPYDGNAFWKKNVLFIEEGRKIKLSEFLRELDELNYQKVYSSAGGISGNPRARQAEPRLGKSPRWTAVCNQSQSSWTNREQSPYDGGQKELPRLGEFSV
ncbi:MAG: hypothetical protein AAB949_00940, partial [Patescibacteria group bacterium]